MYKTGACSASLFIIGIIFVVVFIVCYSIVIQT